MNISTCYHGEVTIKKKDIITFQNGIPGFDEEKEFILIAVTEDETYYALQSIQDENLAFIVTNPFLFFPDYEFKLEDTVKQVLDINEKTTIELFIILTVAEPFEETTANLQGPIIINKENKLAKQIIINNNSYRTKHLLPVLIKEEK
ncbi:flagellar assembly protein FliW [Bacillus alkalisoli]|uniref:flagellar assembly protein FliW n=1 Tax=Bacillus alkalisoli TaxID=2011008 RepID=UPI000C249465|nr:flagellar assembly protein FliW [Bacillus alkalisoli]